MEPCSATSPVTPGGNPPTQPKAPITFTTSAALSAFSISPASFLASRPDIHNLIAGAMVFRTAPNTINPPGGTAAPTTAAATHLETLLLQRAPSDSFPLRWEIPAGTADPRLDATVAGVAVRELWEETQLRARRLVCPVGLGLAPGVASLAMLGEAEDARADGEWSGVCLLRVAGLTWAVVTFIAEVEGGGDGDGDGVWEVVLRPDEHVAWAWVDEEEVRSGEFRGGMKGRELEFVSEAMRMTVLEGFRLRKGLNQECGQGH